MYELRKHTYAELKSRGLGAQAAQHVIKKVRDAYTTLKANIRAGNLGKPGSRRRVKAEAKPIAFRAEAAQPYDDRCLSGQYDAGDRVGVDRRRPDEEPPVRLLGGCAQDAAGAPAGRIGPGPA
ncbi:hypothetical protein [Actinoallomurus iriomotensis]|uniref:hypothetical protein n=1 Tax=Actinoallomurus iriomotensis TaxID=478107 RepID=UPI003D7FA751